MLVHHHIRPATVMRSLLVALMFLVGLVSAAQNATTTTMNGANCPHGLTANDIAALSGKDLAGKVALITGGRSGLGYSIAEALLLRNCTVVIASRNEMRNKFAVEDLRNTVTNAKVSYMTFDLEDFASVKSLASDFLGNHSRLDYYYGNAGQSEPGPPQPLTVDGFERVFQVNYVAQVLLVELLLPLMRRTPSSRIILTASSLHPMACGNMGLPEIGPDGNQHCFDDSLEDNAIKRLPLDRAGLEAMDAVGGLGCSPLVGSGTYAISKFLMIQLAKEIAKREAAAGNDVYAYSFAPGPVNTALLPNHTLTCCPAYDAYFLGGCRFHLPYVGPKDRFGNPDAPMYDVPVPNFWTSAQHGTMAPIYAALHAKPSDSGSFLTTYYECEINKGYFPQGITEAGQAELYNLSLTWAGLEGDRDLSESETSAVEKTTMEETSKTVVESGSVHPAKLEMMVASVMLLCFWSAQMVI